MKICKAAQALIKKSEDLRLRAYRCPAGIWTIGYGHTGPDVKPGLVITKEKAEQLFIQDVTAFEQSIEKMLSRPATINQFSAMVSLAYNIGTGHPRGKKKGFYWSKVRELFNTGDLKGAAASFLKHNKARNQSGVLVVLRGLDIRRKAEAQLFLTPDPKPVTIDFAMIPPLVGLEINPSKLLSKLELIGPVPVPCFNPLNVC